MCQHLDVPALAALQASGAINLWAAFFGVWYGFPTIFGAPAMTALHAKAKCVWVRGLRVVERRQLAGLHTEPEAHGPAVHIHLLMHGCRLRWLEA